MTNQDRDIAAVEERVYGTGWSFPITFQVPTGGQSAVVMAAGAQNVRQSVALLCQTQPGERVMRPTYGCDIQSVVFTNINDENLAALQSRLMESIARFEPRAKVQSVAFDKTESSVGRLNVTVHYKLSGHAASHSVSGSVNVADGTGSVFV